MGTTKNLLEIQKFLKGFQNIEMAISHLKLSYDIEVTKDFILSTNGTTMFPVWLFNYDILKARGDCTIENEARGLILDQNADIVSMSFKRFFNSHEQYVAKLDWDLARAEFKHDGTLVVLYEYKGNFYIQTRRKATANVSIQSTNGLTYSNAVINVLKEKFKDPFRPFRNHNIDECFCWAFEFVAPFNRIVTPYDKPDLYLLSIFNKTEIKEMPTLYSDDFAREYRISRPNSIFVEEIEEILEAFPEIDPLEEGFVVVDRNFNRMKVKNPSYLSISRTVNAGSRVVPRHFAEIVLKGDAKEIISYYPEYREVLELMDNILSDMIEEVTTLWWINSGIDSQKEFAEAVKSHPLNHLLFMLRKGKITTIHEGLRKISPDILINETSKRSNGKITKLMNKLWHVSEE